MTYPPNGNLGGLAGVGSNVDVMVGEDKSDMVGNDRFDKVGLSKVLGGKGVKVTIGIDVIVGAQAVIINARKKVLIVNFIFSNSLAARLENFRFP
jgi:hypothetical protein